MKNIFKVLPLSFLSVLLVFIICSCGGESKKPSIGDKIDSKLDKIGDDIKKTGEKAKDKAEEIDEKVKAKAKEMEKTAKPANKKSAPVDIAFELKGDILTVTISLNKPVANLILQANPLDGLSIEKPNALDKNSYDVPTTLTLPVQLKNQTGRLGIYVAGTFDGRQLASSVTYDFPKDPASAKKAPTIEKDGNGEPIRVMPAKEK